MCSIRISSVRFSIISIISIYVSNGIIVPVWALVFELVLVLLAILVFVLVLALLHLSGSWNRASLTEPGRHGRTR